MNHHYQKVLQAVFAHPISANIDFRDVLHLLKELGSDIDENGNKISVKLEGRSVLLHKPHDHTMPKDEVTSVRRFLTDCGIAPDEV